MALFRALLTVRDMILNRSQIKLLLHDLKYNPLKRQIEPFGIGDEVLKVTGEYHIKGEVRSVWFTRAGKLKYVVEHNAEGGGSFAHIYSHSNLSLLNKAKEPSWHIEVRGQ